MEPQRQSVDWTGRILSIVSLVVALGFGGYVVTLGQVAETRDDLLAKFDQEIQRMTTDYKNKRDALESEFNASLDKNDKRMEDWNEQLVTAIDTFESDAKQLLAEITKAERLASENRLAAFEKEMIELRKLAVNAPPSNITSPENDAADTAADDAATPDNSQLAAHTVLKVIPPDTQQQALIRIENSTDEDALIQQIQFKPESDFRVESSKTAADYSNTDSILVFSFDSSDNTSTKPGYHGRYDRKLTEPIRIPAGETLTMRVVIDGHDHLGWGFAGQLRLVYNSDEPLLIKTARVHFEDLDKRDELSLDDLINQST